MLTRFSALDRPFVRVSVPTWNVPLEDLQHSLDRFFGDGFGLLEPWRPLGGQTGLRQGPTASFREDSSGLTLQVAVPGLEDKDLQLGLEKDVLTLSGERKVTVPEGYEALRQERSGWKFTRSWRLPYPVDAEKVSAQLKNGILTVTLPRVPETQPHRIAVTSA